MRKKMLYWGILMVLTAVMVLSVCKEENENKIEYGSLTIKNLPSVPAENWFGEQTYWLGGVYFDEDITSQTQMHNYTFGDQNYVGRYETSISPFLLVDSNNPLEGFSRSGTFLVEIQPIAKDVGWPWEDGYIGYNYMYRSLMSGVVFKNGKATIDFNDMTQYYSLPQY